MARAFIGLGSNLGDRPAMLADALEALAATPGVRLVAVSHVYESEPWGVTDQPAFANAVVELECSIGARELLAACKRIEREMGRIAGERFGPRPIDLDVLLFGDGAIAEPDLVVPHPRLLERDFVVTPLLEIAPDIELPDGTPPTREAAREGRVVGVIAALQLPRA